MISVVYIVICLWFLESSCGKNFNHPDPTCVGHLGIKPIAVKDANRIICNSRKFHLEDRLDREKSFEMATIILNNYIRPSWTIKDCFLLWRCGRKDMRNPTEKQIAYAEHGERLYYQLKKGVRLEDLE